MINKTILIGRLSKDPIVKTTKNGYRYCMFQLANHRGSHTYFIPCIAWNGIAEFIGRYLSKGNLLCIEGKMESYNRDHHTHNIVHIEYLKSCTKNMVSDPIMEKELTDSIQIDEIDDFEFY